MKRVGQWSVDPGRQSLLQLKEGDREATPSRSRFRRLLFVSGGRSGTGDDEEARNRQPVYISPPFSTILVRLGLCICASGRASMRMLSPCLSSAMVASVSTWSPLVTSGAVPAPDMMRYVTCTLCAVGGGTCSSPLARVLAFPGHRCSLLVHLVCRISISGRRFFRCRRFTAWPRVRRWRPMYPRGQT